MSTLRRGPNNSSLYKFKVVKTKKKQLNYLKKIIPWMFLKKRKRKNKIKKQKLNKK